MSGQTPNGKPSINLNISINPSSENQIEMIQSFIQQLNLHGFVVNQDSPPPTTTDDVVMSDYDNLLGENKVVTVDDEDEFEVKKILNHCTTMSSSGKTHYLIKWKGYSNSTWESEDNCLGCSELIADYHDEIKEKLKNVIYIICRVSTVNQTGANHVSLEMQEQCIREYISNKLSNLTSQTDKYRIEVTHITGSVYKTSPTKITNILHDSKPGDNIVLYRVDRLSRNLILGAQILKDLSKSKVTIHSSSEDLNSINNYNEILRKLIDAEQESNNISKRTLQAREFKKQRGDTYLGGPLMYGYKKVMIINNDEETYHKVLDNDAQKIIKEILNLKSIIGGRYPKTDIFHKKAITLNNSGRLKINHQGKTTLWTSVMVNYVYNQNSSKNEK
jgi:DNA invertase Pin-like site-specific DNA recombinase